MTHPLEHIARTLRASPQVIHGPNRVFAFVFFAAVALIILVVPVVATLANGLPVLQRGMPVWFSVLDYLSSIAGPALLFASLACAFLASLEGSLERARLDRALAYTDRACLGCGAPTHDAACARCVGSPARPTSRWKSDTYTHAGALGLTLLGLAVVCIGASLGAWCTRTLFLWQYHFERYSTGQALFGVIVFSPVLALGLALVANARALAPRGERRTFRPDGVGRRTGTVAELTPDTLRLCGYADPTKAVSSTAPDAEGLDEARLDAWSRVLAPAFEREALRVTHVFEHAHTYDLGAGTLAAGYRSASTPAQSTEHAAVSCELYAPDIFAATDALRRAGVTAPLRWELISWRAGVLDPAALRDAVRTLGPASPETNASPESVRAASYALRKGAPITSRLPPPPSVPRGVLRWAKPPRSKPSYTTYWT